jgi:putative ABC transport system substrate-binding protein
MTKKILLLALCSLLLALGFSAQAQQAGKISRIGYVSSNDPSSPGPLVEAFRQGLRDLGNIEGKNILIEFRYTEGQNDRALRLVAELVQLKVDLLVIPALPGMLAAKQATKTIPIVIVSNADPVAIGLVDSLARPGGNITGLATLNRDLSGKRLELLAEVVPRISQAGVLRDADSQNSTIGFKEYESAARALKIELQSLEVQGPNPDLEGAFQTAAKRRAHALITITGALLFRRQKQIADLAVKTRLPSIFEGSTWVESGGLMSYSTDDLAVFRRAAVYVDKILKGTKPADLPIEQPTKFEFVLNLNTAKQIGLTIPQKVLIRADKVIK